MFILVFNGTSIYQGLYYASRLKNHVHIYIFVRLFYKSFFFVLF